MKIKYYYWYKMLYYLHARHISRLILLQRHVYELASPLPPARLAAHGSQRALERLGTQKQKQHITAEQSARLVAMRSNPVCPATQGNVVPSHEESAITMPQFWWEAGVAFLLRQLISPRIRPGLARGLGWPRVAALAARGTFVRREMGT